MKIPPTKRSKVKGEQEASSKPSREIRKKESGFL